MRASDATARRLANLKDDVLATFSTVQEQKASEGDAGRTEEQMICARDMDRVSRQMQDGIRGM